MPIGVPKRIGWLWILLTVLFGSCQSQQEPLPIPTNTLSPGPSPQVSLLVNLGSSAYIKREGWNDYQPVGFGTLVYPTDLLRAEGGVTLLCADTQSVKTLSGLGRNPCPLQSNNKGLVYNEMRFSSGLRSVPPEGVPYVLYPRGTAVLETRPLLHWFDTGASSYTVEIKQGTIIVWQQTGVADNTLAYPPDAPELVAGKDYLLVVTDDSTGHTSIEDPNKGLGFQLIDVELRAEIEKQQETIKNLEGLDPVAQKFALAWLYSQTQFNGRGLWGEASELMVEVAQSLPDAPAVQLRIGEQLSKMKLWGEAQTAYENAMIQAQVLNDLESQADALAALWYMTGDEKQFDRAVLLYEQLGANHNAEKMKEQITP